ncbi:MAG: hypothetical protein P8184_03370 [Calditrichia bacterium]
MSFDFIIPVTLFLVIGWIIKVLSDNRLRQRLIEKGEIDENIKQLVVGTGHAQLSSLKWGLVLIGLGLALFIGEMFPQDINEGVTVGGMFLFAGIGFLVYYFVAKNVNRSGQREVAEN